VPSFAAAFDEGVKTVMNAYTEINGEPMASSSKYLKEVRVHHCMYIIIIVSLATMR
jgi:hypothetical protein